MAKMYYEKDCELSYLNGKKIAIIGYGSQGHAHALNLKDSGCDVCVGLRAGSKNWAEAEKAGLAVKTVAEAAQWGDIVMMLINDEVQAEVYKNDIAPYLTEGKALATPSVPPTSTARACPASWRWSRTPPATPISSPWPTSRASAAPGPA